MYKDKHTHMQTQMHTKTHTQHNTHTHTSSDLLAPKGVGQDPRTSLGSVTKADRLSKGWAGRVHSRQPWGEWLPGTLAVTMAVRVRHIDRTVSPSHLWP